MAGRRLMASLYIVPTIGDGLTMQTAFRADVPAGTAWVPLMIDGVLGKAIIASTNDNLTGSGVTKLGTGATWDLMLDSVRNGNVSTPIRNQINALCDSAVPPLTRPPATLTKMKEVVEFVAQQVNPGAAIEQLFVQ